MRLRPYIKSDYKYIHAWVPDRRTHALWNADRLPYPLTESAFHQLLEQSQQDYNGCAWTCTGQGGTPIGFFVFSINEKKNSGFVSYVLLAPHLRGQGYGTQMMQLLLRYAQDIAGVSSVSLSVFDGNTAARRCYEKAGFHEISFTPEAFTFGHEQWGRCLYAAECGADI